MLAQSGPGDGAMRTVSLRLAAVLMFVGCGSTKNGSVASDGGNSSAADLGDATVVGGPCDASYCDPSPPSTLLPAGATSVDFKLTTGASAHCAWSIGDGGQTTAFVAGDSFQVGVVKARVSQRHAGLKRVSDLAGIAQGIHGRSSISSDWGKKPRAEHRVPGERLYV